MRTSNILSGLLALSILAASCARKTDIITPDPKPVGGKGGLTTLLIIPEHHEIKIDSCTIYIKYDATAMPFNGIYDDSMSVTPQNGRSEAKFAGLSKGNYYIYGVGYDPNIAEPVTGGTSFTVIDTLANTYEIYIAVTEIGGH